METSVNSYKDYYATQLARSHSFVDFITDQLVKHHIFLNNTTARENQWKVGENRFGLEIKYDGKMEKTGNIYIETAEKSHPSNAICVQSGIYRDDNSWLFGIGDYSVFYIFSKKRLREIHKMKPDWLKERAIATSRGFTMPKSQAEQLADRVIRFAEGAI